MAIKLTIKGVPQPKQSARFAVINNHIRSFKSSKTKKQVSDIVSQTLIQLTGNFEPFTKGVIVDYVDYIFPPLKHFSKKKLQAITDGKIIYKTTKPDLTDNLNKGLFDALEGIIYLNDSQICEVGRLRKFYGFAPRIELQLREVEVY